MKINTEDNVKNQIFTACNINWDYGEDDDKDIHNIYLLISYQFNNWMSTVKKDLTFNHFITYHDMLLDIKSWLQMNYGILNNVVLI